MRRTLFLLVREDVPLVQAAVSTPLATALHRRLASQLERNGSEPPIEGDVGRWLSRLGDHVEDAHAGRPYTSRTLACRRLRATTS